MKYKKPKWAVKQIIRETGLIEDICKHGVGHPNKDFLDKNPKFVKNGFLIHGCDGCCKLDKPKILKKKFR